MMVKASARLLMKAASACLADGVPRLGAALAFYSVVSLAPLLIVAVGIAGMWASQAQVQAEVLAQVRQLMGPSGEEVATILFNHAFDAYQQRSGMVATLIGTAILLFAASIVLHELKVTLDLIWGVEPGERGRIFHTLWTRIVSLAMLLGIGFLLLVSLLLSAALGAFSRFLSGYLAVPLPLIAAFDAFVNLLLLTLLFALLYKLLPDTEVHWRDVWFGAVVAALLFTVGKWLMGLYLGNAAIGSAYGAASSLVIFLLWVYYTAQIFFFGAEVTKLSAGSSGSRAQP
jgi:membrane protein